MIIKHKNIASRLPVGYTEVEYIESSGTQYIDTGFKPNQNTSIKLDMAITEFHGDVFYGTRDATNVNHYVFFQYPQSHSTRPLYYGYDYGSGDGSAYRKELSPSTFILNERFIFWKDKEKTYINNITQTSNTVQTFSCNYNLALMARNSGGSVEGFSRMKLYFCQMWDNGTLVRNFIPAIRNSDNVAGLYDTVTNTFYTNAGTGVFTTGAIIKDYEVLKPRKVKTARLPSEYQEVEYIESHGTEYIDTGYIPVQNDEIEMKNVVCVISSENQAIFSAGVGTYQLILLISNATYNYASGFYKYFATGAAYEISTTYNLNNSTNIKANSNGLYYGSTNVGTSSYSGIVDTTLRLLMRANDTSGATAKLGEVIIKHSNAIVRHMIPCYRKSDTEVGLYDLVNDVFYTNAGTGTFSKGADVKDYIDIKNVYLGETRVYGSDPSQLVHYEMLYDGSIGNAELNKCPNSVGGGWTSTYYYSSYNSYWNSLSNCLQAGVRSRTSSTANWRTTNKINLTNYSFVIISSKTTPQGTTEEMTVNITNNASGLYDSDWTAPVAHTKGDKHIRYRDISTFSSTKYLASYLNADLGAFVYEIYNVALFTADDWVRLCELAGLTPSTYTTVMDLCKDSSAISQILSNETAVKYMIHNCTGNFMGAFISSPTALSTLNSSPYKTTIQANEHWAKFLAMVA